MEPWKPARKLSGYYKTAKEQLHCPEPLFSFADFFLKLVFLNVILVMFMHIKKKSILVMFLSYVLSEGRKVPVVVCSLIV